METYRRHLSRPLVLLAAALFAAGACSGWITYLHRSAVREQHVAGTAAWGQQAAVAAVAALALAITYWRSRRADRPIWLLHPLGRPAASRVIRLARDTLRARDRGTWPAALGRAVLALPLAALFGYGFWRAGFQVTNGLDPNATANAWGGPTDARCAGVPLPRPGRDHGCVALAAGPGAARPDACGPRCRASPGRGQPGRLSGWQ